MKKAEIIAKEKRISWKAENPGTDKERKKEKRSEEESTMGQNQVILRQLIIHIPTSLGVSE